MKSTNNVGGDEVPPAKKQRKSSEKNQLCTGGKVTYNQGVQNPFNSKQIYSEIKNLSWMITTLQELKTLKENFEEEFQLEGGGENVNNEVENQRKYLDDVLQLFSQSVSKYIEICTEEMKKKSDNYENQIKSDNQKMLEKFMSQLVYESEDINDEDKTDISRGFKNHMRLNIATAKIEFKLRTHLVPYIIDRIEEDWKECIDKVGENNLNLSNINIETPERSDYIKLFKVFIKQHLYSHIKDVSQLEHLDVVNELGMQNIHRVFETFKPLFPEWEIIQHSNLNYLVDKAKEMRNEVSHHILVTDKVFEEKKTKFLSALKGFKKVEDGDNNNISEVIRDLKNDLLYADFEKIFDDQNPEKKVNRRAGIKMILPPSFRANISEKQESPLKISEVDSEMYIKALFNYFDKNSIDEVHNPAGFVNDFFVMFPIARNGFYEFYKNNEEGSSKKERKNQKKLNNVF